MIATVKWLLFMEYFINKIQKLKVNLSLFINSKIKKWSCSNASLVNNNIKVSILNVKLD